MNIQQRNIFGFTIIELVVTITIISILAIFGIPTYQTYLIESRRKDAINSLFENKLELENYKYTNQIMPTSGQVTLITTTPAGFYTIVYTRVNDDRYTMTATAITDKSQNGDTGCTAITLTSEMDDIYPANCH